MNVSDVQVLSLGAAFALVGWLLLGAVPAFLVGTWVGGTLAMLRGRVNSLEARIVELEAERGGDERLQKH